MSTDNQPAVTTTDGQPPKYPHGSGHGAPQDVDPLTGQHKAYWVLAPEERAKGFVRPVRRSYRHIGPPGPRFPTRPLTEEEAEKHAVYHYVCFEPYPPDYEPITGRFWTQEQLDRVNKGCGTVTTMGQALAETYARDPHFYDSTFCILCKTHFPVGELGEFIWEPDGERVGT